MAFDRLIEKVVCLLDGYNVESLSRHIFIQLNKLVFKAA